MKHTLPRLTTSPGPMIIKQSLNSQKTTTCLSCLTTLQNYNTRLATTSKLSLLIVVKKSSTLSKTEPKMLASPDKRTNYHGVFQFPVMKTMSCMCGQMRSPTTSVQLVMQMMNPNSTTTGQPTFK